MGWLRELFKRKDEGGGPVPIPVKADDEAYYQQRLQEQIDWYDKKSVKCKRWYQSLRVVEVVLAAMIPFLSGYLKGGHDALPYVVGGMGVMIAIISGLLSLFKFQELWLQYRTTAETLKHHGWLRSVGAPPYDDDRALARFGEMVEGVISKENSVWSTRVREKREQEAKPQKPPSL